MQVFAPITHPEDLDLGVAAAALVELYSDSAEVAAIKEILEAGQIVMPAALTLEVRDCLAEHGIKMASELTPTVGVPGSDLELALPRSHRCSTMISRLLGEEQGDIPISAVYDLLDLMTAIDVPSSQEEVDVVGEVLARAVLGVTGQIPEPIRLAAGLVQYQNAYVAKTNELIDPDAEAAPTEDEAPAS